MSRKFTDFIGNAIGNVFHTEQKAKEEQKNKTFALQQMINKANGTVDTYNPFINKKGELVNPYINYQKVLDNPKVSQRVKKYISQATGLSPTTTANNTPTTTTNGRFKNITSSNVKATTPTSTSGNTIADAAQKYIGTPYVWGGESMAEGGMDCSGFIYNALKDAGYKVGRTTAQGYRSLGTKVSKSDMQPGDLLFFGKDNSNATHIGIYLGNGKIAHSTGKGEVNTKSNPGKGVVVGDISHGGNLLEVRRF